MRISRFHFPPEPGRLALAGGHDAERPRQREEGAEARGPHGGDGLHPNRPPQKLDRPHARL